MEKKSTSSKLHDIQKSYNLTHDELKQSVIAATRPREVKLPELREKTPKAKKESKFARMSAKQKKYELANWYLNQYLKPQDARDVYEQYPKFKELVQYAYDCAISIIQLRTYKIKDVTDLDEIFPVESRSDYDIPDIHWKEFEEFCKNHPLKEGEDIFDRRERFMRYRNKKRKRYYNKKRMRMYDPLFAATVVDEKSMIKNLERISKENEARVRDFHKMLDSLVGDKSIGAEAMRRFDEQTKALMDAQRKRLKMFVKQTRMKPASVAFDVDDEPLGYSD